MSSTINSNLLLQQAEQLKKDGYSIEKIIDKLQSNGTSLDAIQEIKTTLLQQQIQKKRFTGFIWVGAGIFLLSFGFVLTLLLFDAGVNFDMAMYGLTILGIICTLKGIVNIMGW